MVKSMMGTNPNNAGHETFATVAAGKHSKKPHFPLLTFPEGEKTDLFELSNQRPKIVFHPSEKPKLSSGPDQTGTKECPKTPLQPLQGSHYLNEKALPDHVKPWVPHIKEAAKEFGVHPAALAAILRKESKGDPAAVSEKGARGLTQIMPPTFKDVAKRNCIQGDIHDPKTNLRASAAYLRELNKKFEGDWDKTLGFYNGGYKGINQQTRGTQTKNYVPDVISRFWQYMAKPSGT
ncbi:MAG TPA: lytic transglycosylase domain-containing protein [Coleofasciculaceae cyanobacterium]